MQYGTRLLKEFVSTGLAMLQTIAIKEETLMSYRPRENSKQERIVDILNKNMLPNVWYTYSEIRYWTAEYKEGTVSSVLSKCKSLGALEYNPTNSDRRRIKEIGYKEMLNFCKTYKTVSNNLGVTQVVCDKVKALKLVDFTNEEVGNVLKINESVLTDIISCEFNVHKFNDHWRESTAKKESKIQGNAFAQDSLDDMASRALDAVNDLVKTVYHLASTNND